MTSGTAVEKSTGREVARREPTRGSPRFRPAVDIVETADELRVLADVPGANPESIDINFERGVLTIHAKIEARQPEGTTYLLREYGVGDYYRAFEVTENVNGERISAEYRDGVLMLRLPKAEKAKARKVEVHAR